METVAMIQKSSASKYRQSMLAPRDEFLGGAWQVRPQQGWFQVCAQPMRDGVTLQRRLSFAGRKSIISPARYSFQENKFGLWHMMTFVCRSEIQMTPCGKTVLIKINMGHSGFLWRTVSALFCFFERWYLFLESHLSFHYNCTDAIIGYC